MKKTNMLTKKKINKALDAFYWGDISNPKPENMDQDISCYIKMKTPLI